MQNPKSQVRSGVFDFGRCSLARHCCCLQAQQRRLQVMKHHLRNESKFKASSSVVMGSCAAESDKIEYKGGWGGIDPSQVDVNETGVELMPIIRGRILHFFDQIKDARAIDGYNIGEYLPGPVRDDLGPGKRYSDIKQILRELQASHATIQGSRQRLIHAS